VSCPALGLLNLSHTHHQRQSAQGPALWQLPGAEDKDESGSHCLSVFAYVVS